MNNNKVNNSQLKDYPGDNLTTAKTSSLQKENKTLKIIVFFFMGLLLICLGAIGFWFFQGSQEKKEADVIISPTDIVAPGLAEKKEEKEKEVSSPTIIEEKSDLELLTEAFAQKYNHPVPEVIVTINENTGILAKGVIKFEGEMGGGWFLAAKVDGKWIIVDDGNGTISCEKIEPYNFPVSMVFECVDSNGQLIVRE